MRHDGPSVCRPAKSVVAQSAFQDCLNSDDTDRRCHLSRRHALDGVFTPSPIRSSCRASRFVGLDQYERLWAAPRWLVSIENLAIYGFLSLIFSLVIGFVLAALLDQKIRFENAFRTIFLYPFALSFIVTGLVWQWVLNPEFGVQRVVAVARLGRASPSIRSTTQSIVIYAPADRRPLAGHRSRHGVDACGFAGDRRRDLLSFLRGRHSGVADLYLRRHSDDARRLRHHPRHHRFRHRARLRPCGGADERRTGLGFRVPAKSSTTSCFPAESRPGISASTVMLVTVAIVVVPWAYVEFREAQIRGDPNGTRAATIEPSGTKPKRRFAPRMSCSTAS